MREKQAYQRLAENAITSVLGFNVPEMLDGFDDAVRVLEMTIVERPFVLDFAAAYLDSSVTIKRGEADPLPLTDREAPNGS